ncbi:hypothetical protein [Streptomyces sp. NPDC093071]|uniref:hypothetical protein n=1 Tax=Streptomyces sp. NPDC093071 TaxID=3366022 RepID=UPI00380BC936
MRCLTRELRAAKTRTRPGDGERGHRTARWRLLRGDVLIGELSEYDRDQPYFLARFTPGPGWEAVKPLFEARAARKGPDPDGLGFAGPDGPLRDLGLTLAPDDGRRPPLRLFADCTVRIDGHEARLRYGHGG